MKKLALSLAVVAFAAFTLTSCKKDYSCDCTYDVAGTEYTYSFDILKAKKKDAEDACTAYNDTWADYGYECTLNAK